MFDRCLCWQVPWTRQTFNGIMNAYAEVGDTQRCRELCQRMAQQGISPDEVTYSTVLRSYACALPLAPLAYTLHAHALDRAQRTMMTVSVLMSQLGCVPLCLRLVIGPAAALSAHQMS